MSIVVDPLAEGPDFDSPYEGRKISFLEHLILAAYWFGSNFMWGAFLGPMLSVQVAKMDPLTSARAIGTLFSLGAIAAVSVPLIVGPLSDRCTSRFGRRRPFILLGGVITLAGLVTMALAYQGLNLNLYATGFMVLQVGANTALGAYSGIIPDLVPPSQRGIASGFMAVMSQLSTLAGGLATTVFLPKGQDTMLFVVLGAVFALFVAISVLGIKERQLTLKLDPMKWGIYFRELLEPLKNKDFRWVWITRALMMLGFYVILPYLTPFLRDVIRVEQPEAKAGWVFGFILLAATISGYLGGRLSDKVGRKPVVIWASILIAVMCVVFIFLRNLEQALVAGVVFGLGYGAYISVDWALGTDVLPKQKDAGKDMAVWHISMTLPQAIGPPISGFILQQFAIGKFGADGKPYSVYGLTGYAIMFVLAGAAFYIGGILVKNVKGAR